MGESNDTGWDGCLPIHCTNFFGHTSVQGCFHNTNFKEKMESISSVHLQWAQLMKEHITQQENNFNVVVTITNRLSKKPQMADNLKIVTLGFFKAYASDDCFFPVFTLLD